jgi:hypothetical protein
LGNWKPSPANYLITQLLNYFSKETLGLVGWWLFVDENVVGDVADGRYQPSPLRLGWWMETDKDGGQAAHLLDTAEDDF